MDLGLAKRIALVTGAGSGIGAAVARSFCAENVETVFVDIDGHRLKTAARGIDRHASCKVCDVSERAQVERLFSEIKEEYGALHILVNSAAVNTAGWVSDLREEEIDRVLRVNIKGYIYTTIQAVPLMKEAGFGRLIYINSSSGLKASAGLPLYSASKYFDRGFAISTALEVGAYNITANSICPSDVYPEGETGAKSWTDPSLLDISLQKEGVGTLESLIGKRIEKNPMKRACTTDDVAWLALFLASERSGFINGQSIGLNGGQLPY
jgi:NAD(P)-dependent dehydrogenase (short-subunit alcohol dehydrogenase family)